jgi:hypothetical protein
MAGKKLDKPVAIDTVWQAFERAAVPDGWRLERAAAAKRLRKGPSAGLAQTPSGAQA